MNEPPVPDRWESALSRKRKALKEMLDEADLTVPGTKDDLIADNEVAWEIGSFDADRADFTDNDRDGLLVRARRDAYAARLHCLNLLIRAERLERELLSQRRNGLAIFALLFFYVFWDTVLR